MNFPAPPSTTGDLPLNPISNASSPAAQHFSQQQYQTQQQQQHQQQQLQFAISRQQQQQQPQPQYHPAPPNPSYAAPSPLTPAQQALAHAQYQQLVLMNGMNGGNMPAGMGGVPTPAGQQAELNYIYGMVEELSRQLAENRRVTEDIVSGLGRVRSRARTRGVNNDDLIHNAADDINGTHEHPGACSPQATGSAKMLT